MVFTSENLRPVAATSATTDRSVGHTDNKQVIWNEDTGFNTVELDHIPKGDILSLVVVTADGETLVVDGKPSRAGKVISFLPGDNQHTRQAEIKYIIG